MNRTRGRQTSVRSLLSRIITDVVANRRHISVIAYSPGMNCEKCGVDAPLAHRDVDGFPYYLCEACISGWDAVRGPSADAAEEARSPAR